MILRSPGDVRGAAPCSELALPGRLQIRTVNLVSPRRVRTAPTLPALSDLSFNPELSMLVKRRETI